jgi:hypothetical protein
VQHIPVHLPYDTATVFDRIPPLVWSHLLPAFEPTLSGHVSFFHTPLFPVPSPGVAVLRKAPFWMFRRFCSVGPNLTQKYINDRLNLVIEVKELGVILFDLSSSIDPSFTFHGVKLSFNWPVQKKIRLTFLLVLNGLVPQRFDKRFGLYTEMLPSIHGPRSADLKSRIEIHSLANPYFTLSLFLGASLATFLGGGWISFLVSTKAA